MKKIAVEVKSSLKKNLVKLFWSFTKEDLIRLLMRAGISEGNTIMVHSSMKSNNGFKGKGSDWPLIPLRLLVL